MYGKRRTRKKRDVDGIRPGEETADMIFVGGRCRKDMEIKKRNSAMLS